MKQTFLTLQDISKRTHISPPYLKKLIKQGKIKAIKTNKNYLISEYDFLKLLEQMEVKPSEKE